MNSFKKENIVPTLKSVVAAEAISELIDHLVAIGSIPRESRDGVLSAIIQRERSMSTGIGSGVAIPHAATPLVGEIVLAFGRSAAGIDFDALDQQPVRFVVLVIVPDRDHGKHLPILARISRAFQRKEVRAALENASNAEAIAALLDANLNP